MAVDTDTPAVPHHVKGRQFRLYNILMILAMGFGSVSYGYSAGVISQTLGQPSFISYFDLEYCSHRLRTEQKQGDQISLLAPRQKADDGN